MKKYIYTAFLVFAQFFMYSAMFSMKDNVLYQDDTKFIDQLKREADLWKLCKEFKDVVEPYASDNFFQGTVKFAELMRTVQDENISSKFYELCHLCGLFDSSSDNTICAVLQVYNLANTMTGSNLYALSPMFKEHQDELFGQVGLKLITLLRSERILDKIADALEKHIEIGLDNLYGLEKKLGISVSIFKKNNSLVHYKEFCKIIDQYNPERKNNSYKTIAAGLHLQRQYLFTPEELESFSLPAQKALASSALPQANAKRQAIARKGRGNQRKNARKKRTITSVVQAGPVTKKAEEIQQTSVRIFLNKLLAGTETIIDFNPNFVKIKDSFGNVHTIYNITRFAGYNTQEALNQYLETKPQINYAHRVLRWYEADVTNALVDYTVRNKKEEEWVCLLHRCPRSLWQFFPGLAVVGSYTDKHGKSIELGTFYGKVETAKGKTLFVKYESGFLPGRQSNEKICYHHAMRKCNLQEFLQDQSASPEMIEEYQKMSKDDHFPALI